MKFHQIAAAATLALSAAFAHAAAAVPVLDMPADNVVLVTGVTLSETTAYEFDFDIHGGSFSLFLTADSMGAGAKITSFDIYDAANDASPLAYSLKDTFIPNVWSITVDNAGAGSYYASLKGVGTGSLVISLDAALAPVPEPETYGLALAGLLVAGVALRKRQSAA